jgi:hypothetical protein
VSVNKISVLMVCLGNICRSPLAEGILRERANTRGVDKSNLKNVIALANTSDERKKVSMLAHLDPA